MGLTSLQVCMDSLSSDWLQGTIHEDSGIDCSSPSGDLLACSRPLMERRLRPPNDQALKCPRCDSTHTKFCYYNNYSLSQPRYFCKTCRRYWTKGGTLRNIPVGGGCRKNKKVAKKGNNNEVNSNPNSVNSGGSSVHFHHHNPTDLHLSFPPEVQLSHINALIGSGGPNFMLENPKSEAIGGPSSRNYDFMGNGDYGVINNGLAPINYHNLCNSSFGMTGLDGANGGFMDTCQRLMLPYDQIQHQPHDQDLCDSIDVKPNPKLLALEWQDQGCSDNGYLSSSWAGMINGYGSSTTNPLV